MTEVDWLDSAEPGLMLECLKGKVSPRKLRLFAVACCCRVWDLLSRDGQKASRAAEKFADGLLGPEELRQAKRRVESESRSKQSAWRGGSRHCAFAVEATAWATDLGEEVAPRAATCAAGALSWLAVQACGAGLEWSWVWVEGSGLNLQRRRRAYGRENKQLERQREENVRHASEEAWWQERQAQADLLRCIFGSPFRPVTCEAVWLSATVNQGAREIYEEKRWEDLPLLGDALEDRGCNDEVLLEHCRSRAEHVRGCWPLDLVLGQA